MKDPRIKEIAEIFGTGVQGARKLSATIEKNVPVRMVGKSKPAINVLLFVAVDLRRQEIAR